MDNAFFKTSEEVSSYFNVSDTVGLSDEQIKKNTEKYGPNGKKNETAKDAVLIFIILRLK